MGHGSWVIEAPDVYWEANSTAHSFPYYRMLKNGEAAGQTMESGLGDFVCSPWYAPIRGCAGEIRVTGTSRVEKSTGNFCKSFFSNMLEFFDTVIQKRV